MRVGFWSMIFFFVDNHDRAQSFPFPGVIAPETPCQMRGHDVFAANLNESQTCTIDKHVRATRDLVMPQPQAYCCAEDRKFMYKT